MSGSGFMEFQPETVLTATQMNEYLMQQSVMYFDTISAADSGLGSFRDSGTMTYIEHESDGTDLKRPHFYDGSGWQRVATKAEVDAQENRTGQVLLYMEVID